MGENKLLEINNLNVSFQANGTEKRILHDVNIYVNKNETVCIVGESGSGKSVTSLSVMGLLPENGVIDSGSIKLKGKELVGLDESDYRAIRGNDISMIFQEPMTALNPVLTIGFQLAEPLREHRQMSKKEAQHEAIKLLKRVGIPQPESKVALYPHELSGGQRQRVMIAMALATNPSLLIADEPTTALDVTIQAQILSLIHNLKEQNNMGVLFITHDMGVVAQIADYVVVMYHGKIVEHGDVETIFKAPKQDYTKKLLAAVPDIDAVHVTSRPKFADNTKPILSVKDVSTIYGGHKHLLGKNIPGLKAVNQVSFEIFEGETVGLVGESGSGKSTLGRTILGLEKRSHGDIQFEGQPVSDLAKRNTKLIAGMQMIFQDPFGSLDPRQSVGAAIEEVLKIHHRLTKEERHAKTLALLEDVGLSEDSYDRYPHEFSGGQRQRIGIARAIVLDPSLVICDEAVSALDVTIQAQVLTLLKRLQKTLDLTYLFISHDLGVVRDISDRILVMYLGTIVESGSTEQIFRHPVHPYTKRLLSAIPRPDPNKIQKLSSDVTIEKPQSTSLHEVEKGHLVVDF